jgi:parallel beta-helix repeat protein
MIVEFFSAVVGTILTIKEGWELVEIAKRSWDRLRGRHGEEAGKVASDAIREIVAAELKTLTASAQQAIDQAAPEAPPAQREILLDFLTQIPAQARATFRRPDDTSGRTVPAAWSIRTSNDLLPFLPPRLPDIRLGDAPSGADQWQLVERIGIGGFGEVWKAQHRQSPSQFTVFKFCLDAQARQELLAHELRVIEVVQQHLSDHPNVVRLLDLNLHADRPWLRYEYVQGQELGNWYQTWPTTPAERQQRTIEVLRVLAETLAICHAGFEQDDGRRVRVIHRDLKPSNILVDRRGQIKITDFGIGKLQSMRALAEAQQWTEYTRQVGSGLSILAGALTPLYASPEQRRGEEPTPSDDVYALGVLGYQLLIGNLQAEPSLDMDEELSDLGVPEALRSIIKKCLSGRRDRRYRDAGELGTNLQKLVEQANTPVRDTQKRVKQANTPVTDTQKRVEQANALVREVRPTEDLAAIVQSMPARGIIALTAGTYVLREPLRINKSLTLKGPGRDSCIITCRAEEAVLVVTDAERFGLEGVTFEHRGDSWADVVVIDAWEIDVRQCRFTGAFRDTQNNRGGMGIWLKGITRGKVIECESLGNGGNGISVGEQARPELLNNRCEKNRWHGIVYWGSAAGTARDNTCTENISDGIWVGNQAKAELVNNRCEKNQRHGIAYVDSAAGTARDNTCAENKGHGIWVGNQAKAELVNNHCERNQAGDVYKEPIDLGEIIGCLFSLFLGVVIAGVIALVRYLFF